MTHFTTFRLRSGGCPRFATGKRGGLLIVGLFVTPKTEGGLECPVAKFAHKLAFKGDG